jgi:hypothetical protein
LALEYVAGSSGIEDKGQVVRHPKQEEGGHIAVPYGFRQANPSCEVSTRAPRAGHDGL